MACRESPGSRSLRTATLRRTGTEVSAPPNAANTGQRTAGSTGRRIESGEAGEEAEHLGNVVIARGGVPGPGGSPGLAGRDRGRILARQQPPRPLVNPRESFLVAVHRAPNPVSLLLDGRNAGPGDGDHLPDGLRALAGCQVDTQPPWLMPSRPTRSGSTPGCRRRTSSAARVSRARSATVCSRQSPGEPGAARLVVRQQHGAAAAEGRGAAPPSRRQRSPRPRPPARLAAGPPRRGNARSPAAHRLPPGRTLWPGA